ncbi:hypothetical protein B0T19DRAFT_402000 [Cercophora scortea]|uniref:Uncharacterized protein n=1 Tax=Cercophora scortea TaxID=314031 RepID=A0AAE0IEL5_9PEZI|nr:hypothetical protein B0T19DRAFT_402000 [Cercophora scortea]
MAQVKVAPQHALRVTPYTHLDHMASSEVPNNIVDDNYDAPIFKTINFPYPGRPMEPVDTAPTQAPNKPSNGDYSAPIHMVLNFTDAVHGPSVTMDQVKEMIRVFVQEAVRSLKYLYEPKGLFEKMLSTPYLDTQNRPLPKDEDEVASHLEERLITVFEKLMAANGVPNNVPDRGRHEDERVSNGEPERNRAALASKLEYKRGDDGNPQSFQLISLWDQYSVVTD